MEITKDHKEQIEQIIKELECPRKYECYKSKFEELTPVKASRFGQLVECSLSQARLCPFKFDLSFGMCCTCPLRNYIFRHFHK